MPNTIYNPLTGNFDYVIDDAAEIAYTPADPSDWPVAPDDTKEALDSLANTVASLSVGAAPDATTTTKGIVKLAGDLGGTADLPTVPDMVKSVSNVGGGQGVYKTKDGYNIELKSITGSGSVSVSTVGDEISILGSGEANTASNVGGGNGVVKGKTGVDLQFKSLVAGSNVTITSAADTLTIDASGGSGSSSGPSVYELLINARPVDVLTGPVSGYPDGSNVAYSTRAVVVNNTVSLYSPTLLYSRSSGGSFFCKRFDYSTVTPAPPILIGSNVVYNSYYISATNFSASNLKAVNWTATSGASISNLNISGAASATIAVRVGSSTTSYATSTDGITWTSRTFNVAPTAAPQQLIYAGSLFFLFYGAATYLTSPDGITWTSRTALSGSGSNSRLIFDTNSSLYIYILTSGTGISTSPDGITWTSRTNTIGGNCRAIISTANFRITVVTANGVLNSTDGITYTPFYSDKTVGAGDLVLASSSVLWFVTSGIGIDRAIYNVVNGRILADKGTVAVYPRITTVLPAASSAVSARHEIFVFGISGTTSGSYQNYAWYDIYNETQAYSNATLFTIDSNAIGNSDIGDFVDGVSVNAYTTLPRNDQYIVMGNNFVFEPFATANRIRPTTAPSTATLSCISSNVLPSPNPTVSQWAPHAIIAASSNASDSVIWGYYSLGGSTKSEFTISTGITGAFRAIEVHNNVFLAIGDSGCSMRYVHSAANPPDNIANWSSANLSSVSTGNFTKIVAGNGVFIAIISDFGANAEKIYVSSDLGISWSLVVLPHLAGTLRCYVFFLKGKFYALGYVSGPIIYENVALSSTDGINWTREYSDLLEPLLEDSGELPTYNFLLGMRLKKVMGRTYAIGTQRCAVLPAFEE